MLKSRFVHINIGSQDLSANHDILQVHFVDCIYFFVLVVQLLNLGGCFYYICSTCSFLTFPAKLEVGFVHIIFILIMAMITQIVDICEDHQKESKLARLLEEIGDGSKILVFVETKRKCDELTRSITL